jgi:hypothetical protein
MKFENKHTNIPNFKNKAKDFLKNTKPSNLKIRKKIIYYKNNKLIISPLNRGLKIKWIKKLSRFKQKMAILKKNVSKINAIKNGKIYKSKKQIIFLPFSKLFTSLRIIKLGFIRYYKFPLQQGQVLPRIMKKNRQFVKGIKVLNSYEDNLIQINKLNTDKKENLNGPLIAKLKLNADKKENFIDNMSGKLHNNLNDLLYRIKTKIALESSDYSSRSLHLNKKLDLAFSASQTKDMRDSLISKIKLQGTKNNLKIVSSKNLLTSISFDTSYKNTIKNIKLSKNLELESKRELPLQPNLKMAYYNYITYPYKKRVKYPSILNYYSSWKSGNSVYTILYSAFERMSCLISKPYIYETPNRLSIQLFYYSQNRGKKPHNFLISSDNVNTINDKNSNNMQDFKNVFLIKNQNKFNNLCLLLSKLFNKQVVLDITRIKRPYYDVTILSQLFHKNSQDRNSKFIKLITFLFYTLSRKYKWASSALQKHNKTKISQLKSHDFLRGFKLKLGGRLLSQKIIPRISSKTYNRGKIARGKVHFVNTSRIISKHKRGAYSITITTSSVIL